MANQQAKIIDDIYNRIYDDTDLFNNRVDNAASSAFYTITSLLNKLQTVNNQIKISVENIRIINQIKSELNNVVLNSEYRDQVGKFVKAFDDLEKLNNKYFGQIAKDFEPKEVYKEVKNLAVDNVKNALLGDGFKANITDKLVDVINQNMASGAKMEDLVDQVRIFLTDTKEGDGAFKKYAKTYTTNAINKYNASYNQVITSDLELEWYKYTGSLLDTSREFCKELINAKKNGMEYIHKSQFNQLLNGDINGKQIPINDKTELPYGMEAGTNASNLTINRGGWNCGHQFMPVSSEVVPKELRDKYERNKTEETKIKEEVKEETKDYINSRFSGDKLLKEEQIKYAKISGIPLDYNGTINVQKYGDTVKVSVENENIIIKRELNLQKMEVYNEYFRIYDIDNNPYKGKGFEIFANQVEQATNEGFKKLKCYAARGMNLNGYYTWARFGYIPQNPSKLEPIIKRFNNANGTDVKSFGELMSLKEGQEFWKDQGDSFDADFDLSDGSYSQTTFKNYYNGRKQK